MQGCGRIKVSDILKQYKAGLEMEKIIQEYKTVFEDGSGEIVEKKSRFIANVHHVESEEEAVTYIESLRKTYWDARHNCYAYIIGKNSEITRCSDDGEPGGSAGKPILEIMLKEDLTNAVIVVTRYFGGVLLGTGGLVRAYGQAAKEGINHAVTGTMRLMNIMLVKIDYTLVGKVKYLLAKSEVDVINEQYEENVVFKIAVVINKKDSLCKELSEATSGRIEVEEKDIQYIPKMN